MDVRRPGWRAPRKRMTTCTALQLGSYFSDIALIGVRMAGTLDVIKMLQPMLQP
jgi:hypothetical protein